MNQSDILDGYLVDIVQHNKIKEQSDIKNLLKERGYDVPQATISRRLKKLGISKIEGVYKIINFSLPNLPLVLSIRIAHDTGLLVLHTHPGQANGLAYFIDRKYVDDKKSDILGTIAGDDTVLIILKSKESLNNTLTLIYENFPYLKC